MTLTTEQMSKMLEIPVEYKEIPASLLHFDPAIEHLFLNLPHRGGKNIVVVGSESCGACVLSLQQLAGSSQQVTKCEIYKIDAMKEENKKKLTLLFGSNYLIPMYFIELENRQLIAWSGDTLKYQGLVEYLVS